MNAVQGLLALISEQAWVLPAVIGTAATLRELSAKVRSSNADPFKCVDSYIWKGQHGTFHSGSFLRSVPALEFPLLCDSAPTMDPGTQHARGVTC